MGFSSMRILDQPITQNAKKACVLNNADNGYVRQKGKADMGKNH